MVTEQKNQMNELELVRVQLVPDKIMVREEPIKTSQDAAEMAIDLISSYDREVFAIININAKGQALNMHIVSIGDLCSSVTHPREVFKSSVLSNSGSIIAIHGHPSGDPTPSDVDKETTRRLCEAGKILGIPLLDHIIVGCNTGSRYSMRAYGDMDYLDDPSFVEDQGIDYAVLSELEKKETKEILTKEETMENSKRPLQERISVATEQCEHQVPEQGKSRGNERV